METEEADYSKFSEAMILHIQNTYISVLRIRLDPFHFDQLDPDPGSKKSAKIMENFHQNHKNILHILKNNKLMFNGHEYLPHKYQNRYFFGEIYFL